MKARACACCREVLKSVKLGRTGPRAVFVIVAPNIEEVATGGGPDDMVLGIINAARESGVPVIFALSRNKLGRVSCGYCTVVWCLQLSPMRHWCRSLSGQSRC